MHQAFLPLKVVRGLRAKADIHAISINRLLCRWYDLQPQTMTLDIERLSAYILLRLRPVLLRFTKLALCILDIVPFADDKFIDLVGCKMHIGRYTDTSIRMDAEVQVLDLLALQSVCNDKPRYLVRF